MPESRRPTTLSLPSDREKKQRTGYVRCGVTHIGTEWSFEPLDDKRKIAIATIMTDDGPIEVGLNRAQATTLHQQLGLFLQDWPEDQAFS
jgi:hypothetical protein